MNMESEALKGYYLRKNGKRMKNRRITVILPELTVKIVMEKAKVSQAEAEDMIIRYVTTDKSVECCGLQWLDDKLTSDSQDDNAIALESPIIKN